MHMHMHMHAISMTYMHMHMHAISMHIMCMCMQMCMHVSFALAGSYQQPIEAGQSSVIGNGGWNSLKRMGNVEHRCWLQIDAGRKVHVMGWKIIVDNTNSSGSYFNLKVSDDGNAWEETGIQLQLGSSAARCRVLQNSFAHARYFRFEPNNSISNKCQVGLLVLDDQGAHLVGPRYVRDHSPLHIAAKAGDVKMIKMLLDHGADPEMRAGCWQAAGASQTEPCGGKTALQLAAAASSLPAVQALVECGATVHEHSFAVPNGREGDLVAGYLQTNGSKPVARI